MPTTTTHPTIVRQDAATATAAVNDPNDKSCTVTFTSPVVASPPQTKVIYGLTFTVCTGNFAYSVDPITFPAKTNAKIKFDLSNNSAQGWQLCKFALLGYPNGTDGLPGTVYADANNKIDVTDNNQGANTVSFSYGILVINSNTMQCAGSDPVIINDGGGGPDGDESGGDESTN